MGDEPFFPPPKARGSPGYREPAERPITPAEPAEPADPIARAPKIVSRPEPGPPRDESRKVELVDATGLGRDEHRYWANTRFSVRYARITGGLLVLASSIFLAPAIESLRHHHRAPSSRVTVYGPILLFVGLYMLILGRPVDPKTGRASLAWRNGIVVTTFAGVLVGLALLFAR